MTREQPAASQVQGAAEVGADVEALADRILGCWMSLSAARVEQAPIDHCRAIARNFIAAGWVSPDVAEAKAVHKSELAAENLLRAMKAETKLERLREGVKALADEWSAEDSSEWHYLHQPDVGRAIEAVKGALVPELRGLLDEDGGA